MPFARSASKSCLVSQYFLLLPFYENQRKQATRFFFLTFPQGHLSHNLSRAKDNSKDNSIGTVNSTYLRHEVFFKGRSRGRCIVRVKLDMRPYVTISPRRCSVRMPHVRVTTVVSLQHGRGDSQQAYER